MHPLSKNIASYWQFVLGIAVGVGAMSLVLFFKVIDATDYLCQVQFQECAKNPLADCMRACSVKQIDPNTLQWLFIASLPFFLLALFLYIMHRDAKRK